MVDNLSYIEESSCSFLSISSQFTTSLMLLKCWDLDSKLLLLIPPNFLVPPTKQPTSYLRTPKFLFLSPN